MKRTAKMKTNNPTCKLGNVTYLLNWYVNGETDLNLMGHKANKRFLSTASENVEKYSFFEKRES